MKSALKTLGLLVTFLLVMSITIKDRPLFTYVYEFISPATEYAQDATEEFFERSVTSTQSYSKKIFDNSVPKVKDSVKSKLASRAKTEIAEPAERIMEEEKEELDELIKNH
jgi:hypothetical protein